MNKEYIITDGKRFIKKTSDGRYVFTKQSSIATVWDNKRVAEAILHNSIPQSMRFELYITTLENGYPGQCETISQQQALEGRKRVCSNETNSYKLSKYSFDNDAEVQKLIKGFADVKEVLSMYATDDMHHDIEDSVMKMNLVVEDIKHYHGRKCLSSIDGFRLNKLEDKAIVKRISVKNQHEISKKLKKHYASIVSQIDDICKTIDELREQEYTPRVLVDLFENDNFNVEF